MSVLIILLIGFYRSVWGSYNKLFQLYRETLPAPTKPPVTALQASYLFSQQKPLFFMAWLIQSCQAGALTLHYKKGIYPWHIYRKKTDAPNESFDLQLFDILFSEENKVHIEASGSEPNPIFEKASERLTKHIKTDTSHLLQNKPTGFPAWLLLAALLAEVLCLNGLNALQHTIPAIALVVFSAVPLFAFCKVLPSLLNGKKVILWTAGIIFILISVIVHWAFLSASFTGPYITLYFFPEAAAAIGVLVYAMPALPKDINLLTQIIGYQKFLGQTSYLIKGQDLAWTLGFDIHSDIFDHELNYQDNHLPEWLKADESDVQKMIRHLHLELPASIKKAIYGELEHKRSNNSTTMHSGTR